MSTPQAPSALEIFLRSRHFILCVVLFSVCFLTPNTYFVYFGFMEKFISPWREIASAGVAFLVASGIMIYTVRGNKTVASYYAWFEISISAYYYMTTIGWNWGLIPAFSFVFMLPISLKNYTGELEIERDLYDNYLSERKQAPVINEEYVQRSEHPRPELLVELNKTRGQYDLLVLESKAAITELEEKNRSLTVDNQLLAHQLESIREKNKTIDSNDDILANLY